MMVTTDDLINQLSSDLPPVRPGAVGRRLLVGLVLGALASGALVIALLGPRPDLAVAVRGFSFWMKWGYTASLALVAIAITLRLARPEARRFSRPWILALPVVVLAAIGLGELNATPRAGWPTLWLGDSWQICSALVFLLSLPIFAGLLWAFRAFAPTRLRVAGAAAGLTAGACSATIYCLHCTEVSALFVLVWYSAGMVLAALLGALLGPRLLRW